MMVNKLPNVLIIDDNTVDLFGWQRLNMQTPDVEILSSADPNRILLEWLRIFAEDHIPRALVVDWHIDIPTMGCLQQVSESGTEYTIDGTAFVLWQCLNAVADESGMFVIYTNDVAGAAKDIEPWGKELSSRVRIIDKGAKDHAQLLSFITTHPEYTTQAYRDLYV